MGARIFHGVGLMQDSSTYQIILDEGRIEMAKRDMIRFGRPKLGPLDQSVQTTLNAINDLDRLERMLDSLPTASNWQELLATP